MGGHGDERTRPARPIVTSYISGRVECRRIDGGFHSCDAALRDGGAGGGCMTVLASQVQRRFEAYALVFLAGPAADQLAAERGISGDERTAVHEAAHAV